MTATRLDITIEQGADYTQPFQPILDRSGNPVNIMAATAAMQIRTAIGDPTALVTLTTSNGGLTPSSGGIWLPFIDEDITTALLQGTGVYDMKMILSGVTSFPFRGIVNIAPEITIIVPPAAIVNAPYILLGVF